MAIVTDGAAEKASGSTELNIDGITDVPAQPESATGLTEPDRTNSEVTEDIEDHKDSPNRLEVDRSEEVPSLLGRKAVSDHNLPGVAPDQVAAAEDTTPADDVIAADDVEASASAVTSLQDQPAERPKPEIIADRENSGAEPPVTGAELKAIMASLQDSVANTQYISLKIETVSEDTAALIKQVNSISLNSELLAAELESISSGASAKGMLSKTFLTISSLVLAVLVTVQIYMFFSLYKIQRLQNSAGSSVLEQVGILNKKMAEYDKNLTKAIEKTVKPEQPKPNPVTAEKADLKNNNAGSTHVESVHERLNKLRSGLPEKKLIRKETGDWFVFNKKNNECISDDEVIQALNEAYRKTGRKMPATVPLPPINALCLLRPDGKGGTQIVMTEQFLP